VSSLRTSARGAAAGFPVSPGRYPVAFLAIRRPDPARPAGALFSPVLREAHFLCWFTIGKVHAKAIAWKPLS